MRVYPSSEPLSQEDQLAFKMACMALDPVPVDQDVVEMVVNRIIDNASVALASLDRTPVANARSQALCHPRPHRGALVFGLDSSQHYSPEWAAWANGTAVRELDFHDTFLAADYSHPGDNIPPILAVAQTLECSGSVLVQAIVAAYEIQVQLVKGICLHRWKKDHIAHLGIASAGGLGALIEKADEQITYQAMQQALHVTFATRQSRKGDISSWKAYAPAFGGKMAIEAMDRALRGERAPSPIYEGEDSVIAWMLEGKDARYKIQLPEKGEPKRAILETYTKEHSAEYQSQAFIDLAFKLREKIGDLNRIRSIVIHTSHHTHNVIGTGAGDPQKMDPKASRETLDHSLMYIFAVALEDGFWHHQKSYTPERAGRSKTQGLWHKISTREDPLWTERYHSSDPKHKAFGGRVVVEFSDGDILEDELAVANAHVNGARPFGREQYIHKFRTLTEGIVDPKEGDRFLEVVQNLPKLKEKELDQLNVQAAHLKVCANRDTRGIF